MRALERAAKALCDSVNGGDLWDEIPTALRVKYRNHARAALMAVRDIDGGIERAAEAMDSPGHPTPAYRHFHLAIDAILADGEEG